MINAGWIEEQISREKTFTDGKIQVFENKCRRRKQKRADYILWYRPGYKIAIVEAKAAHKSAADGLQQAKDYCEILDLNFAYSSNGKDIIEYNFLTGKESILQEFP